MEIMLSSHVYLISALLCLMLLVWSGKGAIASTVDLMLKRTVFSYCLSFFFGALIRFTGNSVKMFPSVMYSIEYFFIAIGIFFWCSYVETLFPRRSFITKRKRWIAFLMLFPVFAFLIANLFTPILFCFDDNQRFCRLFGHSIYFLYLFLCSAWYMVFLFKQTKYEIETYRKLSLFVTALLPAAVLLNALWKESFERIWPVACVLTALIMLSIFMGRMLDQISIDVLTQVNNRHNLMGFLNHKLKNASGEICLMMIDIDDFKHINDSYGHLEGDKALTLTASALKRACGPFPKRPYIARYGGDEFIIIMDGGLSEAETLKSKIVNCLDSATIGYDRDKLTISVGISQYKNNFDAKSWIADADKNLYAVKSIRPSSRAS